MLPFRCVVLIFGGVTDVFYILAKAIEKYEKTRADSNNAGGSGSANTGGTVAPEMQGCSYKTFMNDDEVKFAMCTFKGRALTQWNGNVQTLGLSNANQIPWSNNSKEYHSSKLRLCYEANQLWPVNSGRASVQVVRAARNWGKQLKGNWNNQRNNNNNNHNYNNNHNNNNNRNRNNNHHQQQNRRPKTVRAYAAAPAGGKIYAGNLPKCNRCNLHHHGPCPQKCQRCQRIGHMEKDCRVRLQGAGNDFLQNVTCFGCGEKGHFKDKCPKAGNQQNDGARGRAYVVIENPQQNPNVVTGASQLFSISIWLALSENVTMSIQLKILQEKGFIRPSLYHGSTRALCQEKDCSMRISSVPRTCGQTCRYPVDPRAMFEFLYKNWKTPESSTEIRLFLGLAGYYRRFIENFSKIAKPLTLLTQKNKAYVWGDKQRSFPNSEEKLCMSTEKLAKIYTNEIVARHGVPVSIILDRDGRFTSHLWQAFQKALGTRLDMINYLPPQPTFIESEAIQTLKDMLRAGVYGYWWHLFGYSSPLIDISYITISPHTSIKCAPFEALYGRKCRSPMIWTEVGESQLIRPEIVQETTKKIIQIKERLKTARSRQKS
ncbi:putative reverse transcriptase domain-containing protein [Tanacetum coccineum]